jgi:hypothetical protein
MEGGPMKTDFLRAFAACAVTALAALCGTATAQDIQLASSSDVNNIYARLAELESRVAASNVAYNGGGGPSCGDSIGDCGDECCRGAGFVAGGEVLWLKAFNSDSDYGDFNYEDAFRFWIGWQREDGLGVRLRVFDYDDEADNGDTISVESIDAEIYDTVEIGCHWDLVIGGGIRYLEFEDDFGGTLFTANNQFFGVGPVVTAELYRHISERAALYAIARQSILVGSGEEDFTNTDDTTTSVSELQLGAQVHRPWNSALLFGRIGWEAQAYHDIHDSEEMTTLMGVGFSAGISR